MDETELGMPGADDDTVPTALDVAAMRADIARVVKIGESAKRRANWTLVFAVIGVVVVSLGVGWVASTNNTVGQVRDVQRQQAIGDYAAQCRAGISGAYSDLVESKNTARDRAIISGFFGDNATRDAKAGEADKLLTQIERLPARADAYREGVTIEGHHYTACPQVRIPTA